MSTEVPIREGQVLTGPLFSEPMQVETVRANSPGVWVAGLVGQRSARFRRVTLTPDDISNLTIADPTLSHEGLATSSEDPQPPQGGPTATIAPDIVEHYPELSDTQRKVIGCLDGPLLVIAGPGSGKTYCIVLRALNLLLLEKAKPQEIVLCTFTNKAAYEMRDRLAAAAQKVGYKGDLSNLTISTIHGFCNRVLTQHRHRTELGHSY